MKQIVVIHGGDAFDTYEQYLAFLKNWQIDFDDIRSKRTDWKDGLGKALGEGYEMIAPKMPNKINAKYLEWKIWFEKFIPHLEPEVILIGHSMGGIFLAKYLSENKFPKKILATFLVSAPHDGTATDSIADFVLPASLDLLAQQGGQIFLYHSQDDMVVSFADFEKYQKELPTATSRIFTDRGHINQEELPEIVADIKSLN